MTLAISASLVGVSDPRAVQVVVSGIDPGTDFSDYTITGQWAGGTWDVRAGRGTAATATQVVVVDVATPVNVPITYLVEVNQTSAESSAVTVDYDGDFLLQSLDGQSSASFRWLDNGDPRQEALRTAVFYIPGRSRPVTRWDVSGGEAGELRVSTSGVQTEALRSLVRAGAPLLIRTDGSIRDLAAVEFVQVTSARNVLSGEGIQSTNGRSWTLGFEVIDDPEPDTLVAASDWADFDASYAVLTWADFDTEWAGQTWSDFDVHDWATRAAT